VRARGFERGAVLPIEQVWRLAKAWYGDPRAADWTPRTKEMSNEVLESVALTGAFWHL
jgi:hypothetical protein